MLAEIGGFSYTLYLEKDATWGAKDEVTGQWNGMVRDLVTRVRACDLHVT